MGELLEVHAQLGRPLKGELLGVQLKEREIVDYVAAPFPNSKTKACATALSESNGKIGSYNDNFTANGEVWQRDCGLFQDAIQARMIDTEVEWSLRTLSTDKAVWEPVVQHNVEVAYDLYMQRMNRDTGPDIRMWQPWVGYTSGWAMFPGFWVWKHARNADGDLVPVGPWTPTGKFLPRAIRGVANWHHLTAKDMTQAEALAEGERLAEYWKVKCDWYFDARKKIVNYRIPKAPVDPPADGIGPRPIPNDGR
jgi:hypothetical protein